MWILAHLGALVLLLLAAAAIGRIFLTRHRFDSVLERAVFTLAVGLGSWALLWFALGLVGLLHRRLIVALTIAGALALVWHAVRSFRASRRPDRPAPATLPASRKALTAIVLGVGLCYGGLLFQLPQYPPMFWDSTAYHLVLAKEYLSQHQIALHEGLLFPIVPALNHMLFAWALAIGDGVLAQMVEHVLMVLVALALYTWGKRLDQRAVGVAAGAFWLGTPLVVTLGGLAFVDVGIACYAFLGVYALRIFSDTREPRWWYLGAALIGMSAGAKLSGVFFVAIASAFGLWAYARSQMTGRVLIGGGLLALLTGAPWYAVIGYHTGNPLWPGLIPLSHGSWRSGAEFYWQTWGNVGVPRTVMNFVSLPFQMVLRPDVFVSFDHRLLLPLVAAFPIAWGISFVDRSVRWWTVWALAYTGFWFASSQQLRFWLPAIPLVGLALYESLAWVIEKARGDATLQTVVWTGLTVFAVQIGVQPVLRDLNVLGWPAPYTGQAREKFLERFALGYTGLQYVNQHARATDVVYSMNGSWLNYYFKPKVIDVLALAQGIPRPVFRWPQDASWARLMKAKNVEWVFVNHASVLQVPHGPKLNPAVDSIWPDYELVYADASSWVFRRRPGAREASRGVDIPRGSLTSLSRPVIVPAALIC